MISTQNLDYLSSSPSSSSKSVEHTYEDELRQELCLQLAECVHDLGAFEFTREVECEGAKWLVTVTRQ